MKPSTFLLGFLVVAILGGVALFSYRSTLPNTEQMVRDVTERLLRLEELDSSVNELSLRNRFHLDQNYDQLTRAVRLLTQTSRDLNEDYFGQEQFNNSLVQRRFKEFNSELVIKTDLIENFKSHNAVLKNSVRYVPAASNELRNIAANQGLTELVGVYEEITRELLEFALLGTPSSVERIKILLANTAELETGMPEFAQTSMLEFLSHVNTVLREQSDTDAYLTQAIASTTDSRLADASGAWSSWLEEQGQTGDQFTTALFIYIAVLLVAFIFLTWRLRGLYTSMDHELAVRSAEVESAYQELKDSETQLIQSEKLASLGQLVAGVAHQINTPLGYTLSNVETVSNHMDGMKPLIADLEKVSQAVSKQPPDRKVVNEAMSHLIRTYRARKSGESLTESEELLKDASFGLKEISEIVSALKDFSGLDKNDIRETDIHTGLDGTLKICANVLGAREIIKNYSPEVPTIEGMPTRISQLFMNVITNAAQATKANGEILLSTQRNGKFVEVLIADDGCGMDETARSRIFDPFFTTKDVGSGTGLGMSIAYKIAQSHGGDIDVESEPGQGTQITIKLPINQV